MNFMVNFISYIKEKFFSQRGLNVLRWKFINGDETLNINYPLNSKSVVFDVGGYGGNWSATMYAKYKCEIYVFEPVIEYANEIQNRFKKLKKIHVLSYGLSSKNTLIKLHLADDSTSEFGQSKNVVNVKLVNFKEVLNLFKIKKIDLISINIEGGEYNLLDYLIKSNLIKRLKNVQIQFHPFIKKAKLRMNKIQKGLKKTHILTYQFPFVWENWTLIK